MTAKWGTKPLIVKKVKIEDEGRELEHGEYYSLEETSDAFIPIYWEEGIRQLERDIVAEARQKFEEEEGATLVYAEARLEDVGVQGFFWKLHTKYVLKVNHPIAPLVIIAIGVAVALVIGAMIIAYGFYHLIVSAGEWVGGGGGVIVLVVIFVVLFFVAQEWMRGSRTRRRRKK